MHRRLVLAIFAIGCGDNANAWRAPTPLALPVSATVDDPTLTADRLELYFNYADTDIDVVTRSSIDEPWGAPSKLDALSSGAREGTPGISGDGRTLYFTTSRDGTYDIWSSTRTARGAAWSTPHAISELNSSAEDFDPTPSLDELMLVFTSARDGNADLFITTRASRDVAWNPPRKLSASGPTHDAGPMLSADGLTLYFDSARQGTNDLYEAHRASVNDPFDPPTPIVELNTTSNEDDIWISGDGRHMVFSTDRSGIRTLWETSR